MKKRILLFAVSLIFVLGFTACGKAKQSAEELIQQENEIIAEHQDLWDLAFNAVDKDTVGSQTGDYADFLKINLNNIINKYLDLPPVTVVGNLPYNITGQIITKLIKNHALFDKAVIMIQKEAAQKLCAAPSQDGYRAISVLTQYFTNVTPLFDVTPDCFIPPPHVTSSVILMKFKESLPLAAIHEGEFISFIHKIFCQRRKLITSVFQTPCEKDKLRRILNNLELSEKTRGEQLDHSQLSEIFRLLYMNKNEILGN